MGRLTLTTRLLILTLMALAPALVVLTFNIFIARTEAVKEVHKSAFATGHLASLEMNRIVSSVENTLNVLALVPVIAADDPAACDRFLAAVDSKLDMIANLVVLADDGALRCGSTTLPDANFSDRAYFTQALATKKFVVGAFITDRITGRPALPLALPVVENSAVTRVIVALLDLHWLGERVKERDFSQGNALTIADRDGIVLAREPQPERFVGTRIRADYLDLVTATSPGTVEVDSRDGVERVVAYFPATNGIYVSVGLSLAHELQDMKGITLTGIAVIVLAVVGPFIAVWLASRAMIRRPAKTLVRTVTAWRNGENGARTGMRGSSEFETVGAAVDDFMDQLVANREQRLNDERLRDILVRELDHRIKNLLATVQAVARQTFKSGGSIEDISENFTRRIQAMAGAHQLLTKNWQSASLIATVKAAIGPFSDQEHVRFRLDGADLDISASAALALSMALHELCTNATKYGALSAEDGTVAIEWRQDADVPEPAFFLSWTEAGGPPVGQPQREGFGTLMIERVLSQQLNAKVSVDYRTTGVCCTVQAPLKSVRACSGDGEAPARADQSRANTIE